MRPQSGNEPAETWANEGGTDTPGVAKPGKNLQRNQLWRQQHATIRADAWANECGTDTPGVVKRKALKRQEQRTRAAARKHATESPPLPASSSGVAPPGLPRTPMFLPPPPKAPEHLLVCKAPPAPSHVVLVAKKSSALPPPAPGLQLIVKTPPAQPVPFTPQSPPFKQPPVLELAAATIGDSPPWKRRVTSRDTITSGAGLHHIEKVIITSHDADCCWFDDGSWHWNVALQKK